MHLAQGLNDQAEPRWQADPTSVPFPDGPARFTPGSPIDFSALTAIWPGSDPPPQLLLPEPVEDDPPIVWTRSEALAAAPGGSVGRYQVLGEIARGGMGVVLKARDADLGRDLAVKVLLERHRDDEGVIRRFVEEAQIGGQLQHPGIVPVHEVGAMPDRRPFFTMKLVKGRTLSALLATRCVSAPIDKPEAPAKVRTGEPRPINKPEARAKVRTGGPSLALQACEEPAADLPRFLAIFEAVCQTVAYAHARCVIHRDLKPANVMVGSFGEVQVMDWGLAKVLPEGGIADEQRAFAAAQTESLIKTVAERSWRQRQRVAGGQRDGHPGLHGPRAGRGEVERLDERCDVFGLGAILCEILTGKPPFVGQTRDEIRGKAARGDLADAMHRLDTSAADPELIALARDCLSADRQQRPRDAGMGVRSNHGLPIRSPGSLAQSRAGACGSPGPRGRGTETTASHRRSGGVGVAHSGHRGAGWSYLAREQQRRAVQVDLALREAELRRDDAQRTGDDLSRWLAARDAAQAVARLVADARDVATGDRVTALLKQVEEAARTAQADHMLLEKLVEIRSAEGDDPDGSVSDSAYADAFREAGIDVDTLQPGEWGARIRNRPLSVWLDLVAAIDDWAMQRRKVRPRPQDAWRRLVAAARAADPEPVRDRLRQLWSKPDRKAWLEPLRKLAQEADPMTWPAQSLRYWLGLWSMRVTAMRRQVCFAAPSCGIQGISGSITSWEQPWNMFIRRGPRMRSGSTLLHESCGLKRRTSWHMPFKTAAEWMKRLLSSKILSGFVHIMADIGCAMRSCSKSAAWRRLARKQLTVQFPN